MGNYTSIEVLITYTFIVCIPLFLGFYGIYIGLKYYKTGELSYFQYVPNMDSFKLNAKIGISFGVICTLIGFYVFLIGSSPRLYVGILIDIFWSIFLIAFFYWYMKIKK